MNPHHWPLSAALEEAASAHPLLGEGDLPPQFVAQRTLEDWYYALKKGGFEGLKPRLRSDRGKPRRLSAKRQPWILEQEAWSRTQKVTEFGTPNAADQLPRFHWSAATSRRGSTSNIKVNFRFPWKNLIRRAHRSQPLNSARSFDLFAAE